MKNATGISKRVRERVYARDSIDGAPCCICCGHPIVQVAHFVPRSRGGKGVETNLACLCPACHWLMDNGDGAIVKARFRSYLEEHYPGWDEKDQVYSKW